MEINNKETRRVVIGITAHVDAGKTTLAEAMLYRTGQLRKLGRVDHGSAAMDSHLLERERGITIFLSQAELPLGDMEVTLLDTPGHVDFSAEMERTLSVLDYAILVISGVDGVQAHTRTLWRLLELYRVPTFLFVTKMDFGRRDRDCLMESLHHELGEGCIDFTPPGTGGWSSWLPAGRTLWRRIWIPAWCRRSWCGSWCGSAWCFPAGSARD